MKRYLILVLYLLLPVYTYAQAEVNLNVSDTQVELWEVFEIQLSLNFDSSISIPGVSIPGIEDFEIFSQTQWESVRQVNDQFERTSKLVLQLRGLSAGEFTLWPVSITVDGEQYNSESHTILVWPKDSLSEDITNTWSKAQGIHGLKKPQFQIPYFLLFCIGLILVFYLLIHKVISTKKIQPVEDIPQDTHQRSYISELEKLQTDIENISQSEFFMRLHEIVRNYIGDTYNITFPEKYTFQELKPHIKNNTELTKAFYDSYIHEFNGKNTTLAKKRKMVQDYIDIL